MKHLLLLLVLAAALAVPTAQAGNIILNPSFEVWLDSIGIHLPVGWLTSEITWPGTATRSTAARSGEFAVRLIGGDTAAFVSTVTVVQPGRSYLFSGWAHVPGAPIGGTFLLEWFKLLGGAIGSPTLLPVYFSTGYREYSQWLTAPDSAAFLSVNLATLPGVTVYVDDVTLDDTLGSGVREPGPATWLPAGQHVRKVIGSRLLLDSLVAGARVYDAIGRRVLSQSRVSAWGIYFVVPRAFDERR